MLYEQYLKPLGLLQAGFFYKQLSDPIFESVVTPITTDQFGSQYNDGQWSVSQPTNGSGAHLYGFEIAYQQHLTFLPGPLGGLGISANYGYTNSRIDGAPGRSDKPALARQAHSTASHRSASERSAAARKAAQTKGRAGRSTAARKAARTRAQHR